MIKPSFCPSKIMIISKLTWIIFVLWMKSFSYSNMSPCPTLTIWPPDVGIYKITGAEVKQYSTNQVLHIFLCLSCDVQRSPGLSSNILVFTWWTFKQYMMSSWWLDPPPDYILLTHAYFNHGEDIRWLLSTIIPWTVNRKKQSIEHRTRKALRAP